MQILKQMPYSVTRNFKAGLEQIVYVNLLFQLLSLMDSKYRSSISSANLASELRGAGNVTYLLDFKNLIKM